MTKVIVAYTDPSWALGETAADSGAGADRGDDARDAVERDVFGAAAEIRLGLPREDGEEGFETSGPRFRDWLRTADAVVVHRARLTGDLIAALADAGRCKVVARQGVGTDNIDLAALRELRIPSFHVPDYCIQETADHALALMLALERGICTQDRIIRRGQWDTRADRAPRRLGGSTLGIIGFGRIGSAVARKASLFYGTVLAYDPAVHPDAITAHGVRPTDTLQELLGQSDTVTVHASLDDTTEGLIDRHLLRHARPGALLVNTARGRLVDPAAVLDALGSGLLGGYATDVYAPEDPADDPTNQRLALHERVVSTCHRGFLSQDSDLSLRRRVATEIRHVLSTGTPPRYGRLT
ncbi:C-terminal binding protein [Streptomyces sp. NPDC001714]|uniref:C-terminal binding protein n=1 Tax=Streptomyces sp. NPDC001714 TaxID=3364603 RepID=UPI00369F8FF6